MIKFFKKVFCSHLNILEEHHHVGATHVYKCSCGQYVAYTKELNKRFVISKDEYDDFVTRFVKNKNKKTEKRK